MVGAPPPELYSKTFNMEKMQQEQKLNPPPVMTQAALQYLDRPDIGQKQIWLPSFTNTQTTINADSAVSQTSMRGSPSKRVSEKGGTHSPFQENSPYKSNSVADAHAVHYTPEQHIGKPR